MWTVLVSCALVGCVRAEPSARLWGGRGQRVAPPSLARYGSVHAYEWFVRAELFAARGDDRRAIEAYRMALASSDPDTYLLAQLARALDRQGQSLAAERTLQAGLELDPASEAIWLARGDIARRHQQPQAAFEAYARAQVAAPGSPVAPLSLSALAAELGSEPRALALLERLAAPFPARAVAALHVRLEAARTRGDVDGLRAASIALSRLAGRDDALRAGATLLLQLGHPGLAHALLARATVGAEAQALRLQIALALRWRARAELALAAGALGGSAEALDRADAYLRIAEPRRALEELDRDSTARRELPARHALLTGRAHLQLRRTQAALPAFIEAAANPSLQADALAGVAQCLERAGLPALAGEVQSVTRERPRAQ